MYDFNIVKVGTLLVLLNLVFGIGLGITFGIAEDSVQDYIARGIAEKPDIHDEKSKGKIWKYAKRAHYHATGIGAFCIGLVLLTLISSLKTNLKKWTAILISFGGLYPLSWFNMFLLSPSIGRKAAHHHIITELLVYVGVGGLLLGIAILSVNLFLGKLQQT